MNERPALESLRVRTHPRTVTRVPSGTVPFRIDLISMRSLLDMTRHYPSSILLDVKVGLISLGCPKNLVDSEVMLGLAQQAGHELTRDAADADVLVVNTCAFIDKAKQESIDTILEMAQHKKDGRCTRLVVTGCMAERYREELKKEIPEIDAVLGTGEVPQIVEAIGPGARLQPGAPSVAPLAFYGTAHPAPLSTQQLA